MIRINFTTRPQSWRRIPTIVLCALFSGLHVSSKQYTKAAGYLEQALDCQRSVQTAIRGDMLDMMKQLGLTYTLAGDLDRAIECYRDCVDAYHEVSSSPGPALTGTLGSLANLYHVKGGPLNHAVSLVQTVFAIIKF